MKKVVILTSRFPYPLERGDKLRIYHHIRLLSETRSVTLIALSDQAVSANQIKELERFCDSVYVFRLSLPGIALHLCKAIFSRKPFQSHYFFRPGIQRKIQTILRGVAPDVIYCQLLRMARFCDSWEGEKVLDYMDTFSLGMDRRITQSSWWKRPLLRWEKRRLLRYEDELSRQFDRHSIISAQDRDALPFEERSSVAIIPNGVDATFFSPDPMPQHELVFVGNMGYFPNVRAAEILAKEILPALRSSGSCSLLLAGARPVAEVKALEADPDVHLTGWLDDIRDGYRQGKIFVAPLFAGSGQQNKILEAMAMGLPCIVTPIVNEAIGARDGQEIFVASEVEEMIQLSRLLLENEDKRRLTGAAARAFVESTYDWNAVASQVDSWLFPEK